MKMKSRELGLLLAQRLLDADDLHYGLWDDSLELSFANVREAQKRYTAMLFSALPPAAGDGRPTRVLDVGCGTGVMLAALLDRGYDAEGVVPDASFARMARGRLAAGGASGARVYECRFEAFPADRRAAHYDAVLFSESFQYVRMDEGFAMLRRVTRPGGVVVICDFFRSEAEGDGGPGDGTFRGGKPIRSFHEAVQSQPFAVLRDEDITRRVSPNLELVNTLLMQRVAPAGAAVWEYLRSRHPVLCALARGLFGRRFQAKVVRKYFSGLRSRETFERYKTYRLIVLRHAGRS
jgi:SAM-dependent methyltransferase